jgi:predicted enzyme involved in methoxymalonyl-ACP biosynthesis
MSEQQNARAGRVAAMRAGGAGKADSTMMQLTQAVTALEKEAQPRTIKIGVSSSATVDLLNIYLRKHGLLNGARIDLVAGNYDDPIGDIDLFAQAGVEQIVLLPFFDNLLPSFEAQLESLDPSIIDAKEQELRQRYRMVFDKARAVPAIYLGTFHRMGVAADASGQDAVAIVLARFNAALRDEAAAYANVRVLDTEDIVRAVGQNAAFDTRFYFRSKAPYTGAYMNELARRIAAAARGFGAHFYKVLALDCDNTLWGGVIGEDLLNGIKLGPYDYPATSSGACSRNSPRWNARASCWRWSPRTTRPTSKKSCASTLTWCSRNRRSSPRR